MTVQTIPIDKITKGRNPRKRFDPDQLQELAQSIREHGLLQPIIVEPHRSGAYVLVAGERRLRAHVLLKRKNIQAMVRDRSNHHGRERFLASIVDQAWL